MASGVRTSSGDAQVGLTALEVVYIHGWEEVTSTSIPNVLTPGQDRRSVTEVANTRRRMRTWMKRTVLPAVLLALTVPIGGSVASNATASASTRITTPEQFFGFKLGTEGKLARWAEMMKYYKLVADRSDRVLYEEPGKTATGQPFPVLTVSSPKNLKNLNRIKQINQRLADPRGLTEAQATKLAAEGKPVYLLEAAIHSTEVGTSQVIPNVLHRLADEKSDHGFGNSRQRRAAHHSGAEPGRHRMDGRLLQQNRRDELRPHLSRPLPEVHRSRQQPRLVHDHAGRDEAQRRRCRTTGSHRSSRTCTRWATPAAGSSSRRTCRRSDPNIDPITVQQTDTLGMAMQRGLTADGKKGVSWGSTYDYWTPSRQY